MINVLLMALLLDGFVTIVVDSTLFDWARLDAQTKPNFLKNFIANLISCSICVSFWFGFFLGILHVGFMPFPILNGMVAVGLVELTRRLKR